MTAKPSSVNGTILIVEDHREIRWAMDRTLRGGGYAVLTASGATEALTLAQVHPGSIDLLISEVLLWGMTGAELFGRLRQRQPALRVLLVSGYTDEVLLQHGVSASTAPFLRKPFAPRKLVEKVREVLHLPAPAMLTHG